MATHDPNRRRANRFALKLLGRRIRRARLDRGLSRHELFRLTGISAARLSNIENGYEQIKGSELFDVAEVVSLPFEYFISGLSAPDADGLVWVGDGSRLLGRYDERGQALSRLTEDHVIRRLIRDLAAALSLVLP